MDWIVRNAIPLFFICWGLAVLRLIVYIGRKVYKLIKENK